MAKNRHRARDRKRKTTGKAPDKVDGASNEPVDLSKPDDDVEVDDDVELERELDANGDGAALDKEELAVGSTAVASAPATKGKAGSRLANFIKACWAELQRVQWPDRRQVGQATAVVLGFVVIAGAFLGFADFVAQKIVDLIL